MANLAHTVQGSLASSISSVRKQNNNYMIMRLPRQFYRSLKISYFCLKNFLFLPILKKYFWWLFWHTKCRAVLPIAFGMQANKTTITGLWVCSTRPRSSLKNGILLPKLFWPTVWKNCSSDWEKLMKFEAEGREFAKLLRSLEQFIQTVKGQNNFW